MTKTIKGSSVLGGLIALYSTIVVVFIVGDLSRKDYGRKGLGRSFLENACDLSLGPKQHSSGLSLFDCTSCHLFTMAADYVPRGRHRKVLHSYLHLILENHIECCHS